MKKLALSCILPVMALLGCQQNSAEVDALRKDVDALKLEVFGDPLATCPTDQHLTDISAYQAVLGELPDSELEADEWHKLNAERDGVITLPSGLQYSVVKSGNPDAPSPVGSEVISVNYHGFFLDGKIFDSSYDRGAPLEFPANGVIKGWIEGLGKMKPCDAWTLYIPGDLAYGSRGRSGIPPNATLAFHVQLLGINQ
ncbi:MAG: FKBP-type peptidyl-prolyl cis-trans isomerase [Maricaulaceae bacterium]